MPTIPRDFLHALRQSGLEDFFVECPYLPQTEYLRWIAAAKRPHTRRRRIQRAVVQLFAHWVEEIRVVCADFDPGVVRRNSRGIRRPATSRAA